MKKVLFWFLYLPMVLTIVIVAVPSGILEKLDKLMYRYYNRFEDWCFDDEN